MGEIQNVRGNLQWGYLLLNHSKLSKQDLKVKNATLCYDVKQKQMFYDEARAIVEKLDREYDQAKGSFPLFRYGKLKLMIKESTTEENLDKAKPKPTENSEGQKPDKHKSNGSGGLLQKVKEFSGNIEKVDMLNNPKYESMTKQELARENEEKQKELEVLDRKSLRLFNRLDKLSRDYTNSKQLWPFPRYQQMKEMIKEVTYDTYI